MVSIILTLLVHVAFIFYVGQSSATVPLNSSSTVMHFNLANSFEQKIAQIENSLNSPSDMNKVSKPSAVKPPEVIKKAVKKVFVEQELPDSNIIVQTKVELAENEVDHNEKVDSLADEAPKELTESTKTITSSYADQAPIKNESVVRQQDNTVVQQARFKNLPPAPNYPRRARLRGQQGTSLIHAQLNTTGEVIKTRLVKSSGHSLLDKAAIKAVYQWDFMPGATSQGNVQMWVEIPVQFILNPLKVS